MALSIGASGRRRMSRTITFNVAGLLPMAFGFLAWRSGVDLWLILMLCTLDAEWSFTWRRR